VWSLVSEHRLRVFENRVHTIIFEAKRGKTAGGWIKMQNAKLHNL
jgi:hypothetical protein